MENFDSISKFSRTCCAPHNGGKPLFQKYAVFLVWCLISKSFLYLHLGILNFPALFCASTDKMSNYVPHNGVKTWFTKICNFSCLVAYLQIPHYNYNNFPALFCASTYKMSNYVPHNGVKSLVCKMCDFPHLVTHLLMCHYSCIWVFWIFPPYFVLQAKWVIMHHTMGSKPRFAPRFLFFFKVNSICIF